MSTEVRKGKAEAGAMNMQDMGRRQVTPLGFGRFNIVGVAINRPPRWGFCHGELLELVIAAFMRFAQRRGKRDRALTFNTQSDAGRDSAGALWPVLAGARRTAG
jgi:hypothetical protein